MPKPERVSHWFFGAILFLGVSDSEKSTWRWRHSFTMRSRYRKPMKTAKGLISSLFLLIVTAAVSQEAAVVIRAGTVLDGKGHVLHNVLIVVQGGKIVRAEQNAKDQLIAGVAFYDLSRLTVLPGWIDLHDHITWHFGPNGRAEDKNETPMQAALAEAGNAWVTLMAGFTTIQSVGSPEDKDLRAAINNGALPGPRVLTPIDPLQDSKLT